MGLHQYFRFQHASPETVREFLRGLSDSAVLHEQPEFFVFTQKPGQPAFSFDCELIPEGLRSDRAGAYFAFLGIFVEALTGAFGVVEVEDV